MHCQKTSKNLQNIEKYVLRFPFISAATSNIYTFQPTIMKWTEKKRRIRVKCIVVIFTSLLLFSFFHTKYTYSMVKIRVLACWFVCLLACLLATKINKQPISYHKPVRLRRYDSIEHSFMPCVCVCLRWRSILLLLLLPLFFLFFHFHCVFLDFRQFPLFIFLHSAITWIASL